MTTEEIYLHRNCEQKTVDLTQTSHSKILTIVTTQHQCTRSVQEFTGSFCSSQQNSWCGESYPTSWWVNLAPPVGVVNLARQLVGESGPTSWCGESGPPVGVVNLAHQLVW